MKKISIFVCILLLSIVMCLSAFAADHSFVAELENDTIQVSEEDQVVVLTIKLEAPAGFCGGGGKIVIPDGFKVDDVAVDPACETLEVTYKSKTNKFLIEEETMENVTTDTVLVVTYIVPGGTPAGDYTVGVWFEDLYNEDFDSLDMDFTVSTILTIKDVPACEHEYTYDCDKVCAKCGEETRPEAEHKYANPCDAHCMFCHELTNEDAAHNIIHVEAKESDCFNDGNLEYWYCSECEQYWLDEELTMNTIKDVVIIRTTGHSKVEADNGNGTHRIECCVCSALLEDNIPHDFTSGEADNTCVCGKTYCDHGKLVYEVNQDYGHFVKCALCGEEIGYESHVGEYHIGHIDLGQIMIAMGCKYCGYYPVYVWYSNPEVSTQPGTCMSPAVTTYVFNIEDLPLYAKGENLGDAVYAPEKDGETDLNYHVNEDNWTLVITVIGELDFNNHVSSEVSYQNITDEQHTVYHPCCEATETVDHTFDETTHMCVCGKVETYTLTIEVLATGETVELTVPYGANILEVLEKAAAEDKIPAIDDVIRIENKYKNGEATISGYSYCVDGGKWIYDLEGLTMPAADFKVDQDCVYIGWYYNYDEDDVYVGAEYEDETGWLTPGWHYIEEDYDDVEGGAWYYFYEVTIEYTDGEYTGNIRAEGLTRATYPTEPINGKTYAPNAEDLAYADFIDATEAWFVFGEDGKFQSDMTEIMDGKYVENGMIAWHPGFVKVEGVWYYFVGDIENGGNKAAQGLIYVTRNAGAAGFVKGDRAWFADGKLDTTKSGVIDGYYYEKGKLMVGAGLIKIGEDIYYVRSSGKVATGKYYITKANDLAGFATGMKLYFDENGKMLPVKSGVVDGYYYENGRIVYGAGLIKINGDVYYVCSNGKVATGEYYITKTNGMDGFNAGDKLTFGEDGKLLPVKSGVVDGYYYENGRIAYGAGLIKIDGDIYYVRSNGEVATGKYWVTNTNGLLEAGEYNFGTDGKLITE